MMNWIFVESKHEKTTECNFLRTVLSLYFPDKEYTFKCMDGIGNLFNETITNQMRIAFDNGIPVMVFADADTEEKGWGYRKRSCDIQKKQNELLFKFPFFLWPNNKDDGDVEMLMESLVRKDSHKRWWDCFEDYERCIGEEYVSPNRKAKLHAFITSQKMSSNKRKEIGSGNYLFDNGDYWDMSRSDLTPLIDFFKETLK